MPMYFVYNFGYGLMVIVYREHIQMADIQLIVRISEELHGQLKARAQAQELTLSAFVRSTLRAVVDDWVRAEAQEQARAQALDARSKPRVKPPLTPEEQFKKDNHGLTAAQIENMVIWLQGRGGGHTGTLPKEWTKAQRLHVVRAWKKRYPEAMTFAEQYGSLDPNAI